MSIEKNKTKEMISIIEKLELEINQFQQEEQDESSQISFICPVTSSVISSTLMTNDMSE